jgi:hypothetical protein
MKEDYLHQIWLTKRFPSNQLFTVDGRPLIIHKTGWHNHESGPDFFNGSIELDGITWSGNIEIHIKSSDWYAHKHQHDEAYNNVILHVVYSHDQAVLIEGEEIPTLELKPILDSRHWSSYESLIKQTTWIPCESQINSIDPFFISMQIEQALVMRLARKSELLEKRFQLLGRNLQQLQYETLAQAFGAKINAMPFVELTQRMPIKTIWREGKSTSQTLLMGAAGLLENIKDHDIKAMQDEWKFYLLKYRFDSMEKSSWKKKGLRPSGFPEIRIKQFAQVVIQTNSDFSFFDKSSAELKLFFQLKDDSGNEILTKSFQNLMLMNAIVPLLFWYGDYKSDESYKDKAIDLLSDLPAENNTTIQSWKKLNLKVKSAFDSQGLLELKNEICHYKKCLNCKIGVKILENGK